MEEKNSSGNIRDTQTNGLAMKQVSNQRKDGAVMVRTGEIQQHSQKSNVTGKRTMKKILLNTVTAFVLGISLVPTISSSAFARRHSHPPDAETKNQVSDEQSESSTQERKVKDLKGGMRYRVHVDEYVDKSNWPYYGGGSASAITHAWSELLAQALMDDGSCRVIRDVNRNGSKDEQNFQDSEDSKHVRPTVKKGHMAGAQLGIRPTLTSIKRSGGIIGEGGGGIGIPLNLKRDGYKVVMEIEVYDLQTGITVAMKRVKGTSHGFTIGLPHLPGNTSLGFDHEPDLEKAAADALKKAVEFCVEQFGNVQWISSIGRVKRGGSKVIITVGKRDGVSLGKKFVYGDAYAVDDPDYGEFLGYDLDPLGKLKVTKVTDKMATCEVIPNSSGEPISKTMRIWLPEAM